MATRYGRRAADGTFAYHESKESLQDAQDLEAREGISFMFGLIGLLAGGLIAYSMLLKFGTEWLKWLRFCLVITGSSTLAYVLAKLGNILWSLIWTGIFMAAIWWLGSILWKAV